MESQRSFQRDRIPSRYCQELAGIKPGHATKPTRLEAGMSFRNEIVEALAKLCASFVVIGFMIILPLLICEHICWVVDMQFPEQSPCNQPNVCDTFHQDLKHDALDFWNNDVKKW